MFSCSMLIQCEFKCKNSIETKAVLLTEEIDQVESEI